MRIAYLIDITRHALSVMVESSSLHWCPSGEDLCFGEMLISIHHIIK